MARLLTANENNRICNTQPCFAKFRWVFYPRSSARILGVTLGAFFFETSSVKGFRWCRESDSRSPKRDLACNFWKFDVCFVVSSFCLASWFFVLRCFHLFNVLFALLELLHVFSSCPFVVRMSPCRIQKWMKQISWALHCHVPTFPMKSYEFQPFQYHMNTTALMGSGVGSDWLCHNLFVPWRSTVVV